MEDKMKPNKDILCREKDNSALFRLLNEWSSYIDQCVNFGTHVIGWCNEKPKKDKSDSVIIPMFRHLVELYDGIAVLTREGCSDSATPLLRSMLEAFLGLEYILKEDSVNRALAYRVCSAHSKLASYRKFNPKSEEYSRFQEILQGDSTAKNILPLSKDVEPLIENIENMLKKPDFKRIDTEWKRTKKKLKRTPNWYSLFDGPTNLRLLSQIMGRAGWYEFLYRPWSAGVHAASVTQHLKVDEELGPVMLCIRYPQSLQLNSSLATSMALNSYNLMIDNYIPERKDVYASWYVNEIRDWYLTVTSAKEIIEIK